MTPKGVFIMYIVSLCCSSTHQWFVTTVFPLMSDWCINTCRKFFSFHLLCCCLEYYRTSNSTKWLIIIIYCVTLWLLALLVWVHTNSIIINSMVISASVIQIIIIIITALEDTAHHTGMECPLSVPDPFSDIITNLGKTKLHLFWI